MKYFIDTEFLEGTQTKRFLGLPIGKGWKIFDEPYRQTKPTIDLISIGVVSEDGREYYAISKDFNLKEAWNRWQIKEISCEANICDFEKDVLLRKNKNTLLKKEYWIRENVLKPIWNELGFEVKVSSKEFAEFTYSTMKTLLNKYGKTNKKIAEEIKQFTQYEFYKVDNTLQSDEVVEAAIKNNRYSPKFYGYYSDYDWVVFCWLFGKMVDLPNGFPQYCIDLKQEMDRKALLYFKDRSLEQNISYIKNRDDYPKQTNEHNALADARWHKKLYEFLKQLK
jgi:hypothetical protein